MRLPKLLAPFDLEIILHFFFFLTLIVVALSSPPPPIPPLTPLTPLFTDCSALCAGRTYKGQRENAVLGIVYKVFIPKVYLVLFLLIANKRGRQVAI